MDCSQTATDNAPPNLVMPALPGHAPSRRVPCRARSAVLRLLFEACSDIPRHVFLYGSLEHSSFLRQSDASAIDTSTQEKVSETRARGCHEYSSVTGHYWNSPEAVLQTDLRTKCDPPDHGCILDPDCVLRDRDSGLHLPVMNLLPVCVL